MDPACILMCANIPRGIPEDVLVELFCIAGPIEDISITRAGSCFVIYEFPEAVLTAKEIFKDVELYGRPLEMFDQSDIKQIHERQEHESAVKEVQGAEIVKQYNPFYNPNSMTPTYRNNTSGHPRNFLHPQNLFDHAQHNFNVFPNQFNSPPHPYNSHPNRSYGDNYDPSVPTCKWGSTPEVNQFQSPPSELDPFKSPYSQPVSRKNYEQFRKDDYDDIPNSNYSRNRTNHYSKRHSDQSSPSDCSTEPHNKSKYNQNIREVNLSKETKAEYAYEEQTRQQIYDHSKKSYRRNDRHDNAKRSDASTSSNYSNRSKSRDYDRSPYARNDNRRSDHRDFRRNDKEQRHRRRY